jgi:riboflavin synthase
MFTGIVTAVGIVQAANTEAGGLELTIGCSYRDLEPGESIAVDGACLTVQALAPGSFTAHIIRTSLERTRFQEYTKGRRVNLERALQVGDRLGGHLVQGHVDAVGTIDFIERRDDARILNLRVPPEVARLSVPLGSITVDGVSLTVNAKPTPAVVQISLIPFTLQHTALGDREVGDRVHLEVDAIAKYVAALLSNSVSSKQ